MSDVLGTANDATQGDSEQAQQRFDHNDQMGELPKQDELSVYFDLILIIYNLWFRNNVNYKSNLNK